MLNGANINDNLRLKVRVAREAFIDTIWMNIWEATVAQNGLSMNFKVLWCCFALPYVTQASVA